MQVINNIRRGIRFRWNKINQTEPSNAFQKINIWITSFLTAVSVITSCVALVQTQEIKGMKELLMGGMPSITPNGYNIQTDTLHQAFFVVTLKNFGSRIAKKINFKCYFIDTIGGPRRGLKVNEVMDSTAFFALGSGQDKQTAVWYQPGSESLSRSYVAIVITYKDILTHISDTTVEYSQNQRSIDGRFVSRDLDERERLRFRTILLDRDFYIPQQQE